jgi:hypothetical protein
MNINFYVNLFDLACINYHIVTTTISSYLNQPEESEIVLLIMLSYYQDNNNKANPWTKLMMGINSDFDSDKCAWFFLQRYLHTGT